MRLCLLVGCRTFCLSALTQLASYLRVRAMPCVVAVRADGGVAQGQAARTADRDQRSETWPRERVRKATRDKRMSLAEATGLIGSGG
ncbi:hypothetical protein GGI43DRAFT_390817 [Trichoderma evansii]